MQWSEELFTHVFYVGNLNLTTKTMHAVVLGIIYPCFYVGKLLLAAKTMHVVTLGIIYSRFFTWVN